MILDGTLALWLFIIVFGAIAIGGVLLSRYGQKKTSNIAIRILLGLGGITFMLVVAISGLIMWHRVVSTVVEIEETTHNNYAVVGSCLYESSDGQKIPVDPSIADGYVINVTDRMMMQDYVWYGTGFDMDDGTEFPPHSYVTGSEPDYYPGEVPPNEVEVSSGVGMDIRTWYYFQDEHPY